MAHLSATAPLLKYRTDLQSGSMEIQKAKRVVVCGGGVVGACAAYFLSKNGASVTLVEKCAVACAASGKAGGFLARDWCDGGVVEPLARASFDLHRSLAQELDGAVTYGYRPLTTLSATFSESESKSASPSSSGSLPSWVNGPGHKVKHIGSTETTAQVHPQLFTRTILNTAIDRYKVEVVIGKVETVGVGAVDGSVNSVILEGGRAIESDAVVLALGPWSGKFDMLNNLFRVYGLKAHSIVLKPTMEITPHALFLTYYSGRGGKPMDPEVYPRPTGEVYICGMSSQVEVPDDPEQVTYDPEAIRVLKKVACTVSSHLSEEEAQLIAEQACFLPCTDDGIPVIGEIPGVKGCYVATGHSCWGILNGPATGAAVAELVLRGQSTIVDLSPFSPSRFVTV